MVIELPVKEFLPVKNILITIKDFETTTLTSPIVEKTLELASVFSSKVWLLHVVPVTRQSPYNVDSEMFRHEVAIELHHEHYLLQSLAKCMRNESIDTTALLVEGSVISVILKESERLVIDLVVLGFHKHGLLDSVLRGNTGEGLLAKRSCPIMFVPT